jgi:hypothetical protein
MTRYMPEVVHHRPDQVNVFRSKRFVLMRGIIDDILKEKKQCNVLDVGGTPEYWINLGQDLDWDRVKVRLVNLTGGSTDFHGLESEVGDARRLNKFPDFSFDVVHSNSVIEHVGRWGDMELMAGEVRRLAARYFVQTPNFWFPLEPHARFPLLHWMPESWRYRILMRRRCGFWNQQPNLGRAVTSIQSANLLDKLQMQFLFPDATIRVERYFGLPKSLIAIK